MVCCPPRPLNRGPLLGPWALALLVLFLQPAPGAAQSGILLVRVTDPAGPVPTATVDILYQEDLLRRATTEEDGVARFGGLLAGTYTVRVESLGHEPKTVEGVRVESGRAQPLSVELALAPIAMEGLTVRAERVRIQVENTEFTTQVDETAMRLLPMTHDPSDLIALTPGARPGHVWGGANFQANSYRVDGLSANHPGLGGDLFQPSIYWIDRMEVRGLGAGAEYGGFQGGLIDVVTKRGTNLFQGSIRTTFENDLLTETNLVKTEIGREVTGRFDVEGEVRGPILTDHLFYFLAGKRVSQSSQALNHLPLLDQHHTPFQEELSESKVFGKLTWTPGPRHILELSGGYTNTAADNYGITGFEGDGATHEYSSPTWFLNGSLTEILGDWGVVEARVNHFSRDERYDPYQGQDVPGIRTFAFTPPYTAFGNAPFTLRSAPSSTSANLQANFQIRTGSLEHTVLVGGEYTRGSFLDRRIRNGNMNRIGVNSTRFDPRDPTTWSLIGSEWVMSRWGAEVHLDADVANTAAYVQTALALGPRIVLSPGLRWNQWEGWLTPTSRERFKAVRAEGLDPRMGISVDLTGDKTLVVKGHWGRYHQQLISQMFDRVAGGDVFTNEEYWYYTQGAPPGATVSFTEDERDAMAEEGRFVQYGEIVLNETGPLQGYKQPYVDQWLVGLEKQFGNWMKVELLYTRRSNRDMVALVDLNRATNYTRFTGVRIFDATGTIVPYQGGSAYLQELYVPNYTIVERLKCLATDCVPGALPVPGLTPADTLNLSWDPEYVLTKAPDGKREFAQIQFNVEVGRPEWGASVSYVNTDLKGNLDNVSGYADPESYSAGPYVRVNEGVNFYGALDNYADHEWKISVWGVLPWDLRGGAFWTLRSGDHYSPQWRLYGLGFFRYRIGTGALLEGGITEKQGQEIDFQLLYPLEGHNVYVGPRGHWTLERQSILDFRLERMFTYLGRDLSVTLDVFNLLRSEAITKLNTMVNNGPDYGFPTSYSIFSPGIAKNQYYGAPLERVTPRTFRLGISAYF